MHWGNFQAATSTFSWLILAYLFLQPVFKHRMLKQARAIAFKDLQLKRKSRVIALIHRKEVVNLLGFPMVQFLDIQDSEAALRAIRLTPRDVPIDLILHTPAGLNLSSEQIARTLMRRKARVTVFVPHYAMSGGTLLALVADEIVMCPDAILGALDPLIGQWPAASIISVATRKTADQMSDATFLLLDQARKAVNQMQLLVQVLLARRLDEAGAQQLAQTLTEGRWTQDYPISVEELQELKFNISTDMPEDVLRLMNLFPQDGRRRPSVDFIPAPYTVPLPVGPMPSTAPAK
jgi:ClpP class serine protease